MDEAARGRWLGVQADYQAALAIAKKAWPDGPADVVQAATATLLIEHGKRRNGHATSPASSVGVAGSGEAPRCPTCGGPMAKVQKTNARMPDFRCRDRQCDYALWVDRKHPK